MNVFQVNYTKINGGKYSEFYNKSVHKLENAAIQRYIHSVLQPGDTVVDFGCGAGLGKQLIVDGPYAVKEYHETPETVVVQGVDPFAIFEPDFLMTAQDAVKRMHWDTALILFSAEEIGWKTVVEIWEKSERAVVVFMNNTVNHQGSYLYHKWLRWLFYYWFQSIRIKHKLKKRAHIEPLINMDGYWVAVKKS